MTQRLVWGNGTLEVEYEWSASDAPRIAAVSTPQMRLAMPPGLPLVDVLTVGDGHMAAGSRLINTVVGRQSRYVRHTESVGEGIRTLEFHLHHQPTGLRVTSRFILFDFLTVIKADVTVTNTGPGPVVLRSVPSATVYFGGGGTVRDWDVCHGLSDWLGEGRWAQEPLDGIRFPQLAESVSTCEPRGAFRVASAGTWSTGEQLPVAGVSSARLGASWAWQIEHNGPWRWEIGEDFGSGYVALSGPTDMDHQWTKILNPGESFTTVPVALALAADFTSAIGELTKYRRATRRKHADNQMMGVVFNDYMNTLNGDPSTEKLMPLIDSAADAGAEIFCIDAGWYDDNGSWWDSVGEWRPSATRFPNGLGEIIGRIRSLGMVPGLWLEPEVIGVHCPIADWLPEGAFLQRLGKRVVEHNRYHLDLRHREARDYVDGVVDRLVHEFGIGYFKLDYNINPGAGTDYCADSAGDGLLGHNRAHQEWLDGILGRHPGVILENCASGGMRADFALLSRMQLQSTSDQQEYARYAPIAASAPVAMLPEQAANWAYPQPGMTEEEIAFCLATSLLGRFYLSGHLNRMDSRSRDLVREAVSLAKELRSAIAASVPVWPLGIPGWNDKWIALGLDSGECVLATVWQREAADASHLYFPALAGRDVTVETVFPTHMRPWDVRWEPKTATLHVAPQAVEVAARVFRLIPAHNAATSPCHAPSGQITMKPRRTV